MKSLHQTYLIGAPVSAVWKALTDPQVISAWGGGPAQMDDQVGTQFRLWSGDIHGRNTRVVPEKLLCQEWYSGKWLDASSVTFELYPEGETTRLELLHEDIPSDEFSEIADGWKTYYLGPLKELVEK